MENRADILNELQALSPVVAAIGNANVFSVPEGYFENVSATVLACLHEDVVNIPSADVPKNYFDNLADTILAKIKMQEEDEAVLSPVLQDIRNTNVFTVPHGYFDNLSEQILNKINIKKTAKVIPFNNRVVKYAVAAMLSGAMALGVYRYTNNPPQPGVTPVAPAMAKLDESIEKGKSMNDKQYNEALANLSADDIAKYLEKNGDEKDIELLASNLDENSLPSQDDYILDEKTLENYLAEPDTQKEKN